MCIFGKLVYRAREIDWLTKADAKVDIYDLRKILLDPIISFQVTLKISGEKFYTYEFGIKMRIWLFWSMFVFIVFLFIDIPLAIAILPSSLLSHWVLKDGEDIQDLHQELEVLHGKLKKSNSWAGMQTGVFIVKNLSPIRIVF